LALIADQRRFAVTSAEERGKSIVGDGVGNRADGLLGEAGEGVLDEQLRMGRR
jgi:hypothetical protein